MPTIQTLKPEQINEVRRVIYTTAHETFHHESTLEESIARYQDTWPLKDIDTFQHSYLMNGGTFLVTCLADGPIIGVGALRFLEPGVGEIKRVWLLPAYQGQGLGYQMMQALLAEARAQGYRCVRLETSPAYQPRAFAFYQQMGFREIPRYGDDEDDVGMELAL